MTKAKMLEAYIDYGAQHGCVAFWAIIKFAQELDPQLRLDSDNTFEGFIEITFRDGSSMALLYQEEE
jgi:hypothetical protein